MITLSSTLTSAQKGPNLDPIKKLVLTSGATTKAYLRDRLAGGNHEEEDDRQVALITLDNGDNLFTSLDLKGYKAVLSYGAHTGVARTAWQAGHAYSLNDVVKPTTANGYQYICATAGTSHASTEPTWTVLIGTTIADGTVTWTVDGSEGDEYIPRAPLWVVAQQLNSYQGGLDCHLSLGGIMNLLAEDHASAAYTPASTNTDTVKTIIAAVLGATLACYNHTSAWTVVWDSEDSLIDAYIPADAFSISKNESRLGVVKKLLSYTKEVMRAGNDGKIHFRNPTVSGTTYDYTYSLASGDHVFYTKNYRKRLVLPNYITVASRSGDTNQYSGTAEDTDSSDLIEKRSYVTTYLASNAQAAAIAAAILQRAQVDSEKGAGSVPINVGAEIWDYVKMTDAREGDDERIGNLQYLNFQWDARKGVWKQDFRFGKTGIGGLAGTTIPGGGSSGAGGGGDSSVNERLRALYQMIVELQQIISEILDYLENLDLSGGEIPDPLIINTIIIKQMINFLGSSGVTSTIRKLDSPSVLSISPDTEDILIDLDAAKAMYPSGDQATAGDLGKSTNRWARAYVDKGYFTTRLKIPGGTDLFD